MIGTSVGRKKTDPVVTKAAEERLFNNQIARRWLPGCRQRRRRRQVMQIMHFLTSPIAVSRKTFTLSKTHRTHSLTLSLSVSLFKSNEHTLGLSLSLPLFLCQLLSMSSDIPQDIEVDGIQPI